MVIADFSFLFLFFLGNGWEGRRINYILLAAKSIFARTAVVVPETIFPQYQNLVFVAHDKN